MTSDVADRILAYLSTADPLSLSVSALALAVSSADHLFLRRNADRPVLVFALQSRRNWRIENVGSGPAINLTVADRDVRGVSKKIVNCSPLATAGHFDVPWLDAGHELVAVYGDVHAREYTTVCGNTRNRIARRNECPSWKVDRNQWMEEAIYAGREDAQISEESLETLSAIQLDVLRNSFFAWHGYIFERPDLDAYFRRQPWYIPREGGRQRVRGELSSGEVADTFTILSFQWRRSLAVEGPIPQLFDPSFDPHLPEPLRQSAMRNARTG